MVRRLAQALAWSLTTGAAVTLTWWGVHSVMAGTAYDPPRALPVAGSPELLSSSTQRPDVTRSPSPSPDEGPGRAGATTTTPKPSRSAKPHSSPSASAPAPASAWSGDVRSYTLSGGRVVFDLGTRSAELVSASPGDGWQIQVWKQPEWIRVTFTQGDRAASVFCTWNGHAPSVAVDDH
ncbi:hypothetical protein [Streptomyces sp. NBC_00344]|uniref:hypothetical protein n=1 Tax=Streptomyces sp. NBC_00344 TaxID=2975720 RepID=UPI002E1B755D